MQNAAAASDQPLLDSLSSLDASPTKWAAVAEAAVHWWLAAQRVWVSAARTQHGQGTIGKFANNETGGLLSILLQCVATKQWFLAGGP